MKSAPARAPEPARAPALQERRSFTADKAGHPEAPHIHADNKWIGRVIEAVNAAKPGSYAEVQIPLE